MSPEIKGKLFFPGDIALAAPVHQFLRRFKLQENSQEYDNDDNTQREPLNPDAGEHLKDNVKNCFKKCQSQKKRHIIVENNE